MFDQKLNPSLIRQNMGGFHPIQWHFRVAKCKLKWLQDHCSFRVGTHSDARGGIPRKSLPVVSKELSSLSAYNSMLEHKATFVMIVHVVYAC